MTVCGWPTWVHVPGAPLTSGAKEAGRLFDERRMAGDEFEDALREPLSAVLASPGFLYLREPAVEKDRRALDPLELAARLAYFLWGAPPDEELLALARSGEWKEPAVLAAQVNRMIGSRRSREFGSGFTHPWLGLDRLDVFQFDFRKHRLTSPWG